MATEDDARLWLREHGYQTIADLIDAQLAAWQRRGVSTRRNWWDVLAGTESGAPRVVEGVPFPILAVARVRKRWHPVQSAVRAPDGASAPPVREQRRWSQLELKGVSPTVARSKEQPQATAKVAARRRRTRKHRSVPPPSKIHASLDIRNFAQIDIAHVDFGDLTVLVGPQATGKSLLLQWLKVAVDAGEVIPALKEAGHDVKSPENILDLVFGEGMGNGWREGQTSVSYNRKDVHPSKWTRGLKTKREGRVFFVPAHRALLLAEGWPAPFLKLNADTPVVARLFSQNLYQRFSGRKAAALFPVEGILKQEYRTSIDDAVFHGGKVELEKEGLRYRLRLSFDGVKLPFMTWTAGQREFTPLLLGLYHVIPSRKEKKRKEVDWVVIEEPEMGLHPQAIAVVMLLVLELLWRGYRVVISTHSPLVLETVWAIRRLAEHRARGQVLCDAFAVKPTQQIQAVMDCATKHSYKVYYFNIDKDTHRVTTRDISELNPESLDEAEADWGGLTTFSSRFGTVVRNAVNEAEGDE